MSCLPLTKSEPGMAGDSDKSLKPASPGGRARPPAQRSAWCGSSGSLYFCVLTSWAWPAAENSPPAEVISERMNAIYLQAPNQLAVECTGGPSPGRFKATLFWQPVRLLGCDSFGVCLIPVCCLTNCSYQPRTAEDCDMGWTGASALLLPGIWCAPDDCNHVI